MAKYNSMMGKCVVTDIDRENFKRGKANSKTLFKSLFMECERTSHNVVNPVGKIYTAFCSKCGCQIALDDGNRAIMERYK